MIMKMITIIIIIIRKWQILHIKKMGGTEIWTRVAWMVAESYELVNHIEKYFF